MFWFIEDTFDSVVNTATDFVKDPVRTTIKVTTQPLRDWLEIIDWLTEWELRTKAITRLWADIVGWMAVSELIEWYKEE